MPSLGPPLPSLGGGMRHAVARHDVGRTHSAQSQSQSQSQAQAGTLVKKGRRRRDGRTDGMPERYERHSLQGGLLTHHCGFQRFQGGVLVD